MSRVVWEEHNGPIPEGMCITFKNGDKTNCNIDNLMMVTKAENAALTALHYRFEDPEMTETALNIVKVRLAARKERRHRMKDGRRKPKYEKEVYNNFEMPTDDMDTDIACHSSKVVKVRKDTKCVYCGAKINKGDYALNERGYLDGKPFYVHNCLDCVEEIMDDDEEHFEKWEKRAKESGFAK